MTNPNAIRLTWFELSRGNSLAIAILVRRFGLAKAIKLLLRLEWNLTFDNPFREINRQKAPDNNAKLSQKQMAPMIVLDRLLAEDGLSQNERLDFLAELSGKVAASFLNYNIPPLSRAHWKNKSTEKKRAFLRKLTGRFFNANGEEELAQDENSFRFTVHFCYFAHYARELNVLHLGRLFCAGDKQFFDTERPEVEFRRTQTLMDGASHCDFQFLWKETE